MAPEDLRLTLPQAIGRASQGQSGQDAQALVDGLIDALLGAGAEQGQRLHGLGWLDWLSGGAGRDAGGAGRLGRLLLQ